jgi:hypothetical protein
MYNTANLANYAFVVSAWGPPSLCMSSNISECPTESIGYMYSASPHTYDNSTAGLKKVTTHLENLETQANSPALDTLETLPISA